MTGKVFFDHFEAHVRDVPAYCLFLERLFQGGRTKVFSEGGAAMFKSGDGICIEVKANPDPRPAPHAGVCNPCLRMEGAKRFIQETLGLSIEKTVENPHGEVHFFVDHEGIRWHVKDYLPQDRSTDW